LLLTSPLLQAPGVALEPGNVREPDVGLLQTTVRASSSLMVVAGGKILAEPAGQSWVQRRMSRARSGTPHPSTV
jgi:hypothetical protein